MHARALFHDDRYRFWLLHAGGWAAWGIFGKYLFTRMLDVAPPHYAAYAALITLIGMLLSLPLRYLYRATWESATWLRMLVFLGGSAAAGYLWISSRAFIYARWFEHEQQMREWLTELGTAADLYQKVSFAEGQFSSWATMLVWSALYFAIKYAGIFREVRESALKAAAMAHEAQLKMLRYQLNPHFLFNTLNAISTLILEKDTELANRMVMRLSSFLRYSLDNDPMQKVTLRQELEALGLYLDIERVRFEDRLQLVLDIEPSAESALIPSLLLQPLVENAIKHGISQVEQGGVLRIAARVFAGELLIELCDNGPGAETVNGQIPNGRGVGLRNTRDRLRELYGARHSFRIERGRPSGLVAHIRIPCERAEETV